MVKKDRYKAFVSYFSQHQPHAETELNYNNPFQLLIAVILSAQCTDKRVNMVTPALFERFPTPMALADTTSDLVLDYIKSISYPNNKAKHLVGMARLLVDKFDGVVPDTVENLMLLPGVGRKTANVIVSVVYNQPAMAVDTHVFRLARRIGLTNGKTVLSVEKDLVKNLPQDKIYIAHHWLILHGRYICVARKPKCEICPLVSFCRYYEKVVAKQLV